MKVVVLNTKEADKIMEHFIAYGYDDFISFGKTDRGYYLINDINVTEVHGFLGECTMDRLLKIRGSLSQRFIVAYSSDVFEIDLDALVANHRENQCIATIATVNNKLCAVVVETEIFDYMQRPQSFEAETLATVAQDGELTLYN